MLVSAKRQHEPAIGPHVCPPSWTFLPTRTQPNPSLSSQSLGLSSCIIQHIPLAVCFTYGMYTFPCYSLSLPLLLLLPLCSQVFSMSASSLLPWNRFISTIFGNVFLKQELLGSESWHIGKFDNDVTFSTIHKGSLCVSRVTISPLSQQQSTWSNCTLPMCWIRNHISLN